MESDIDALKGLIKAGVSREALDALHRFFPEKTPERDDSLDSIRYASGQRSVVRFIDAVCNAR